MRVLVLGNGAREHALLWCLSKCGPCSLFSWPGNAGTAEVAVNVHLNPDMLVEHIKGLKADYVVVGPESFLAQGVVDRLAEAGILAFGPRQAAARLESSKSFALRVIKEARAPHPASWVFSNPQGVVTFVKNYGKPVVVKADGLAGGKGVWLCHTLEEVERYARLCWELYPGEPIVVQELLEGREVSVFCFTDGYHVSPLVAACDYKRLLDGDKGPNTGGMGSYAWPKGWSQALEQEILLWVIRPVLRRMELEGMPFQGMLYAGLMLTKAGPKILEFNARFGDPETQVILPLFQGNLLEVMQACTEGGLEKVAFSWRRDLHAVGVVLASKGYPGEFRSGFPISLNGKGKGLVFHASTRLEEGRLVTDKTSGRILTAVGLGRSRPQARKAAYAQVEGITCEKAVWRSDIAS